ncbi:cyclic lactone autoinducer peptide [bacterium D16-76]|nr:cyclic lactone autoinducer peptide [bacterium D16-76]
MSSVWAAIASIIEAFANLGAGLTSNGYGYEPKVPEELQK